MRVLSGTFMILLASLEAHAETIYEYRGRDGAVLFTDRVREQVSAEYVLLSVRKGWEEKRGPLTSAMRDQFDPDIRHAAALHDVDPALIKAVIHAESLFDPFAVSRAGAQGLMQLMPETAVHLEVRRPFLARENILGGARFLHYLQNKFDSLELVLAAYNAGEGNVRRYGGIPPFSETQGYVRKVMTLLPTYQAHFQDDAARQFAAND